MRKLCFFLLLLVFFVFGHGFSVAEPEDGENPWADLSSRDDLRELAGGYGEERLSTVLVTGSVICRACFHGHSQLHAWPVSGAMVGVNCQNRVNEKTPSDWMHGFTDEFGDFIIDIPSHLHATPNFDKTCSVKILRVPKNSRCHPAHIGKPEPVRLSSFGSGIRTYTSGIMPLQHRTSKPLKACKSKGGGEEESTW